MIFRYLFTERATWGEKLVPQWAAAGATTSSRLQPSSTSSTLAPASRHRSAAAGVFATPSGPLPYCAGWRRGAMSQPLMSPSALGMRSFGRSDTMSSGCGPDITFCSSAQSATVRAIGPIWQYWSRLKGVSSGLRPNGGLKPTTPHIEAGMRMEPPMSEPLASGVRPAASPAPEPPEEPPQEKPGFQGVRVTPHRREWVQGAQENSGVAERACMMAPALRMRPIEGLVLSATKSL